MFALSLRCARPAGSPPATGRTSAANAAASANEDSRALARTDGEALGAAVYIGSAGCRRAAASFDRCRTASAEGEVSSSRDDDLAEDGGESDVGGLASKRRARRGGSAASSEAGMDMALAIVPAASIAGSALATASGAAGCVLAGGAARIPDCKLSKLCAAASVSGWVAPSMR